MVKQCQAAHFICTGLESASRGAVVICKHPGHFTSIKKLFLAARRPDVFVMVPSPTGTHQLKGTRDTIDCMNKNIEDAKYCKLMYVMKCYEMFVDV